MTDSKHIQPPEFCTGCALCANICHKDAIQIILNNEGFLVPQVDTSLCINCGRCMKECPAQTFSTKSLKTKVPFNTVAAYGAWHRDTSTHIKSSSGGLFSALAEHVFSENGCVFGVAWQSKITATFCKAENMQELAPMCGSKYVQATPHYTYRKVKEELAMGRLVLFVGTSCQVYALQKYLRKTYERLLTVDIICAGVPSRHLLSSYIEHQERKHNKEVHHINFRYKDGNWLRYKVQNIFTDGEHTMEHSGDNMYMNLFLSGQLLNKCCYKCPYTRLPRCGDITLGDYWGIQNYDSNWPISDGISSIIASSKKGKKHIEMLHQKQLIELHPQPFHNLYKGQPHSYNTRKRNIPYNRTKLLADLLTQTLDNVHDKYYNHIQLCGINFSRRSALVRLSKKIVRLIHKLISYF